MISDTVGKALELEVGEGDEMTEEAEDPAEETGSTEVSAPDKEEREDTSDGGEEEEMKEPEVADDDAPENEVREPLDEEPERVDEGDEVIEDKLPLASPELVGDITVEDAPGELGGAELEATIDDNPAVLEDNTADMIDVADDAAAPIGVSTTKNLIPFR